MIDVLLADAPSMLDRLKQAADSGDVAALGVAAHAIKGSAGLFSQGTVYQLARALEHDWTRVVLIASSIGRVL